MPGFAFVHNYTCLELSSYLHYSIHFHSLLTIHSLTHPTHTTDTRCHLASLQAVAREEASQVSLLPDPVHLCTEAAAATLRQTHCSGMQVSAGLNYIRRALKMTLKTVSRAYTYSCWYDNVSHSCVCMYHSLSLHMQRWSRSHWYIHSHLVSD